MKKNKLGNVIIKGQDSEIGCGGVYLEWYAGVSTRYVHIHKLNDGNWSMEIRAFDAKDYLVFETLDALMDELVKEWWLPEDKAERVKHLCNSIRCAFDAQDMYDIGFQNSDYGYIKMPEGIPMTPISDEENQNTEEE